MYFIIAFGTYLIVLAFIIAIGKLLESTKARVELQALSVRRREWFIVAFNGAIRSALGPTMAIGTGAILATGNQWSLLQMRSDGLWLAFSVILWFLIYDGIGYGLHRFSHYWRPLWALHSLHHSATAVNTTTAQRHTWFESLFQTFLPWPVAAFVISVPADVILIVGLITQIIVLIEHANVKWDWGRYWWLVASPAYHRIHHSRQIEHRDTNFAVFPIWDIIFGTCIRPTPGLVPATGLDDGDHPRSVMEALIWPWRHRLR